MGPNDFRIRPCIGLQLCIVRVLHEFQNRLGTIRGILSVGRGKVRKAPDDSRIAHDIGFAKRQFPRFIQLFHFCEDLFRPSSRKGRCAVCPCRKDGGKHLYIGLHEMVIGLREMVFGNFAIIPRRFQEFIEKFTHADRLTSTSPRIHDASIHSGIRPHGRILLLLHFSQQSFRFLSRKWTSHLHFFVVTAIIFVCIYV